MSSYRFKLYEKVIFKNKKYIVVFKDKSFKKHINLYFLVSVTNYSNFITKYNNAKKIETKYKILTKESKIVKEYQLKKL